MKARSSDFQLGTPLSQHGTRNVELPSMRRIGVAMAVKEKSAAVPRPRPKSRSRPKTRFDVVAARNLVQLSFALFVLWSGWRFYLFVEHFVTGGATPLVTRPAPLEGFLPGSRPVS